jgi:PAS domain S-box-containing protein
MQRERYKNIETLSIETYLQRNWIENKIELDKESRYLILALQSIKNAIIITDINTNVIFMNHSAEQLIGWKKEDAIEKPIKAIIPFTTWLSESSYEEDIDRIINKGETFELSEHTLMMDKFKRNKQVTGYITPFKNEDGDIIGMVVNMEDFTGKYKIESGIQEIQRFESFGTLVSGIAHDFNNILTAILGNISLVKYGANPKEIFERLTETEKSLDRAKHLTDQLLNFSKNEVSVDKFTSIGEVVKKSVNLMLTGSNIKGRFNISDDLWMVDISQNQINQVITNIVSNAIQAMPSGGMLDVSIQNLVLNDDELPPLNKGEYVKISIKDYGIGIKDNDINRIFEPYYTTKPNGSGLGLTVSLSIINENKGHITVSSQVGIGTTFYIYLPSSSQKALLKITESTNRPNREKRKVLILDDDELIRDLTYTVLSNLGYEVNTVDEGIRAIEIYKEALELNEPFDAIIMDLTIPGGMGAKDTIRLLDKIDPNVKAIVSSGYFNDPIITDYAKYGFKGVIVKPYGIKELSSILNNIITQSN